MYASKPRGIDWVGFYEDYCVFVLIVAFSAYAMVLVSSSLAPDYSVFVSTNEFGEHWYQLVAFGVAVPGIARLAWRHLGVGGHTRQRRNHD
jgi:hypothetical protein